MDSGARARLSKTWLGWTSVLLLLMANSLEAGQDVDNSTAGGLNVSQDLRHRIVIPQIIYFRIGSSTIGSIDEVSFDVNPTGLGVGNQQTYSGSAVAPISVTPIGNGTPITATANGTLPVQIMANVGTLTLSYDISDPLGLSDGLGNHIPFDEILVTSADPAGFPTPVLTNAGAGGVNSVNISGNDYGGRVTDRLTDWTFRYANSQVPIAGKYLGRVRYTVAAP